MAILGDDQKREKIVLQIISEGEGKDFGGLEGEWMDQYSKVVQSSHLEEDYEQLIEKLKELPDIQGDNVKKKEKSLNDYIIKDF